MLQKSISLETSHSYYLEKFHSSQCARFNFCSALLNALLNYAKKQQFSSICCGFPALRAGRVLSRTRSPSPVNNKQLLAISIYIAPFYLLTIKRRSQRRSQDLLQVSNSAKQNISQYLFLEKISVWTYCWHFSQLEISNPSKAKTQVNLNPLSNRQRRHLD